jgi:hypothetical protein
MSEAIDLAEPDPEGLLGPETYLLCKAKTITNPSPRMTAIF